MGYDEFIESVEKRAEEKMFKTGKVKDLSKIYYCGTLSIRDVSENFTHICLSYSTKMTQAASVAMAKLNADDVKDLIKRLQILHKRMT